MAKNGTRIYRVFENEKFSALVRARSQAEAIRHISADRFSAAVANTEELVSLIGEGFKVEDAKPDAA